MITRFLSQLFGHTTEVPSTDQDTESENSETCYSPLPSNDQEDYTSESGSQTSLTSASNAERYQNTVRSVTKSEIVNAEGESGLERLLLTEPQVGVDSPGREEELAATIELRQSDSLVVTSPEILTRTSRSHDNTHNVARQETLVGTGLSSPELSPSSTG
jgi:hypothetical protein